jgi:hypothetical protein
MMLVGLVDHLDAVGREGNLQLSCDVILHEHARVLRRALRLVNGQKRGGARRAAGSCEEIVKTSGNKSARHRRLKNVKT